MSRRTFDERLAMIPTDRPVFYAQNMTGRQYFYDYYWFASWKEDDGTPKACYIGRDQDGVIARRFQEQEARFAELDKRMTCEKHVRLELSCKACIMRYYVKAHSMEVWRESA